MVLVLALLVLPLYSAASGAEKRVERKRNDLAWMQSVAGELRAAGPADASAQSLVLIVDQTARAAGLAACASRYATERHRRHPDTARVRAIRRDRGLGGRSLPAPRPHRRVRDRGSNLARRCGKRQPHHAQRRVNVPASSALPRCRRGPVAAPLAAGVPLSHHAADVPASVIALALPPHIKLGMTSGTLWSGSTDSLTVNGRPYGGLRWKLRPLQSLLGRLVFDGELLRNDGQAHGRVGFGLGNRVSARNLEINLPLAGLRGRHRPPGWSGVVHAQLQSFELAPQAAPRHRGDHRTARLAGASSRRRRDRQLCHDFPEQPGTRRETRRSDQGSRRPDAGERHCDSSARTAAT